MFAAPRELKAEYVIGQGVHIMNIQVVFGKHYIVAQWPG